MIRCYEKSDLEKLKELHGKYFADQFHLPDMQKFMCAFVVEDEKGIITMGGVRAIVEAVIVTDQSRSALDRMKAIYHITDAAIFVTRSYGYDQIYAFSQREKWFKRMRKSLGFRRPQGECLLLDL